MAHAASTGRPSIAPSMFSSVACARSWATTQNTRASFVRYAERDTSLLEATVPERAQRVRISIFARLLTIMIIMAVTLLLRFRLFFVFFDLLRSPHVARPTTDQTSCRASAPPP